MSLKKEKKGSVLGYEKYRKVLNQTDASSNLVRQRERESVKIKKSVLLQSIDFVIF